jgi:hypothetical protein
MRIVERNHQELLLTPERLRQIEELYHGAREREPGEREAFLAEACRSDMELRREVESVLAQCGSDGPQGGLMAPPAMEIAANLLAEETVTPLTASLSLHSASNECFERDPMEKDRKMIFQGVSAPTYAEKGESTPSDGLTVDCLPRAPTPL